MPTLQLTEAQIAIYAPQIVSLENQAGGITYKEIAKRLSLTLEKVRRIRDSGEYKRVVAMHKRKVEASVERMTRENTLEIRQKLSEYSGEAVETLVMLMRKSDKDSVKLSAACELIDRDGRFAKVSRLMNVDQGKDGAPMLPEDVSAEIINALKLNKTGMVQ